jgi:hypothetical protein
MSPKSVLSRVTLVAALAISAVALGGCAETTSGQDASPAVAHVPGGYRLTPPVVEARNDIGPRSTYPVALSRSSRSDVAHSDRATRAH